jgi:ADP-ribose pyrophosphatase YjhB (NUDIX family)
MVSQNQLHIVVAQGFVHKDGKFLILKRSEKEIANPGEWVVPGGKVDGAQSISETLKKEIKEESNLNDLGEITYIGDREFTRPDGIHVIVICFKGEAYSGEAEFDRNDFTDLAWVDNSNINNYEIIPDIKETIKGHLNESPSGILGTGR